MVRGSYVKSKEHREKLSKALTGIKRSEEFKRKISKYRTGMKWSDEMKLRMSISRKGIPKPFGFGEKISLAMRGKRTSISTEFKKGHVHSRSVIEKMVKTQMKHNLSPNHYTCLEREFRDFLIKNRLVENGDFFHNYRLGRYVVDFYFPMDNLVVETDGIMHKYDGDKRKIRDGYLQSLGMKVIHYNIKQIERKEYVKLFKEVLEEGNN